jgi:hypothetical protein
MNRPFKRRVLGPDRSSAKQGLIDECAKVVARRYGDGTVYLPAGTPRALFYVCIQRGLITDEGFVTRKGREFLARYTPSCDRITPPA